MVDILCGLGGGEFVSDGDFLEGLGFEFRALGAVAGRTEAEVGADDFWLSVGQRIERREDGVALFLLNKDVVGICGVVAGDIFSAFFRFFVGVFVIEIYELEIVKGTAKDLGGCFFRQTDFVCDLFDRFGIILVLIH